MSSTIAPHTAAVDAASVAFAISLGVASGEEIVLRASQFGDVRASVLAALAARAGVVSNTYQTIEVDAEYGIHGTFLDENASFSSAIVDDSPIALLVNVKSEFTIDYRTLIPVLGDLRGQLELHEDFWPSLVIFIIQKVEQLPR